MFIAHTSPLTASRPSHKSLERGFSLIELMIVISIMGILIAIGIPAYKNITIAANEAAAIKTLKTISTDQRVYFNRKNRTAYAGSFKDLITAGALDGRFDADTPGVDGFTFTLKATPKTGNQPPTFTLNADPIEGGALTPTSDNHYYIDSGSDSVHVSQSGAATPADPVVGQ